MLHNREYILYLAEELILYKMVKEDLSDAMPFECTVSVRELVSQEGEPSWKQVSRGR